jgi:hypothetical protein
MKALPGAQAHDGGRDDEEPSDAVPGSSFHDERPDRPEEQYPGTTSSVACAVPRAMALATAARLSAAPTATNERETGTPRRAEGTLPVSGLIA